MAYTDIDDPSAYFTTLLYTGNATDDRNLTNSANAGDFQPDLLWLKERSSTSSHQLHDSIRESSKAVMSDNNAAFIGLYGDSLTGMRNLINGQPKL